MIAAPVFAALPKRLILPRAAQSHAPASRFTWSAYPMMRADMRRSLDRKVRGKPVHDSLSIDDMESAKRWTPSSPVSLRYTTDRARVGSRSLRFTTQQRDEGYIRANRRPNGSFAGDAALFDQLPAAPAARLALDPPQDWSRFNRLSLWCYVHPTGNPINSLCLEFTCLGAPAGPSDPISVHYFADLEQGEWNHLTWEIPEHARDRVSEITLFVPVWGLPFAKVKSGLSLDLDDIRVERVDVEQVDGWSIAPAKIAYSHVGYRREAPKVAVGRSSAVRRFELLHDGDGRVAATFPVTKLRTRRASYDIYDFGAFSAVGVYRLRVAGFETDAFPINDDPWRELVQATLNGFYGLRCGYAVPDAHDACHCDVLVRHGSETRVVGGGWHDAANLSQDTENTHVSVCALLDLHDALLSSAPDLASRALEEAKWGLEWVARMRFGAGVRSLRGGHTYFTDGKVGTDDDIILDQVGSSVFLNITAALASAKGSRRLRTSEPEFAAELLKAAEEDFATVLSVRSAPVHENGPPDWHVQPWQNEVGYVVLAAVELYSATRKQSYADAAAKYGAWLLDMQERRFIEGSPVTGYFYEDAAKTRILHDQQRTSGAPNSFEEGALLGLAALCEALPNHPDWIEWRTGLAAYATYFCERGAEASRPFHHLPSAVWRKSDLDQPMPEDFGAKMFAGRPSPVYPSTPTPENIRRQIGAMYDAGTYLSPNQRLRTFPLWTDHVRHGGTAVQLTKTIGLLAAARVRQDLDLLRLGERQIQWVVGANPFSRSLVYGVGYDWWQNFTVSLPNMVGGLSVGMNSYRNDSPAWGQNAVFPYKEIWVASSARLAASLAGVCGRAVVEGSSPGAMFRNVATGDVSSVRPGRYELNLAPGIYEVRFGSATRSVTLVPGPRTLILDPANSVDLQMTWEGKPGSPKGIRLTARGAGRHLLCLRSANISTEWTELSVDLAADRPTSIGCAVTVTDTASPWLVVAQVGRDAREHFELIGSALARSL
ncbi:glycoside hydrolase family 9 protein [Sphingomonas sp. CFBP 13706]|uniref:glycoside hydrolase family 9 protein n=1 Tax=Sphingomonas sp. CFBP 13706 TaxID=2775314 RepID=UPI0017819345|nr:glycoside hydrolase family 9 protein [Sphingomonas sp. CFBP 13706]